MNKTSFAITAITLSLFLVGCGKSEAVKNTEELIQVVATGIDETNITAVSDAQKAYEALSEEEKESLDGKEKLDYCLAVVDLINAALDYNEEVDIYNTAADNYNQINCDFRSFIQSVSDSGIYDEQAYDPETIVTLQKTTAAAVLSISEDKDSLAPAALPIGENVSNLSGEEITSKTETLAIQISEYISQCEQISADVSSWIIPDYTGVISEIQAEWDAALDSVAIQLQITNPSEEFIISRLYEIEEISKVQAATEDNDPNGQLHKSGGYTAQVYFRIPTIDMSWSDAKDVVGFGTDGGGSIEVYETVELAEKRRDYLASYDGTIYANGSHYVLGTMIIRTSNELTASQQNDLEARLIELFTRLDK